MCAVIGSWEPLRTPCLHGLHAGTAMTSPRYVLNLRTSTPLVFLLTNIVVPNPTHGPRRRVVHLIDNEFQRYLDKRENASRSLTGRTLTPCIQAVRIFGEKLMRKSVKEILIIRIVWILGKRRPPSNFNRRFFRFRDR